MPSNHAKTSPRRQTARLRDRARVRWGAPHRWQCVYCGAKATEVDHFFPVSRMLGAAADTAANLVPACPDCNRSKSNAVPFTWMAAAGVPESHVVWLAAIWIDTTWRKPRGFEMPQNALNRPKPPQLGQFQGS